MLDRLGLPAMGLCSTMLLGEFCRERLCSGRVSRVVTSWVLDEAGWSRNGKAGRAAGGGRGT